MKSSEEKRRLVSILSVIAFFIILGLLTWLFLAVFSPYLSSADTFRSFLESFGWKGRFILFGLQCVQILVAFIPGEVLELSAGYAYGVIEGTLICYLGIAISSTLIFLLVRKIGTPMVECFFPRSKIEQLRFLNTEKKRYSLLFILFFLPGTPKDILTYFSGLLDISLPRFLLLTLFARFPSVVSSTLCGHFLGEENYLTALIVYAITAVCSIAGYFIYVKIIKNRRKKSR